LNDPTYAFRQRPTESRYLMQGITQARRRGLVDLHQSDKVLIFLMRKI
jgi:hypothetical protein